jgi:glycosyltransferase involved in cell wall biosynthesis
VCPPEPKALAARIEQLWRDRDLARRMGEAGLASVAGVGWDATARRLLQALGFAAARPEALGVRHAG